MGEILKKRIEYEEEQEQKTPQCTGQTIRRSAQIAANNGIPVPRKLSNSTLLIRSPDAAAAPPRLPATAATITYFGSDLPTATPPRVHPPRRSPRLAEQAARRAVTKEILWEKATTQKDGPAQQTRSGTRSIAQEAMLTCANVIQLPISPRKLALRKYPSEMINAVLNQETGEMMEYRQVMKTPKYRELYEKEYAKELGRLAQGTLGLTGGTKKICFINKGEVPPDRWQDVTYGRILVNYRPEKYDP